MKTIGYGETRPMAPNTNSDGSDNPEELQKNRRVEIVIKKK
jgi:outer membrane protein OmpA-like peptidoglycan-associated protein